MTLPRLRKPEPIKFCEFCETRLVRRIVKGQREDLTVFRKRRHCNRRCGRLKFLKAACHPDRLHYGHGLCAACYRSEHREHRAEAGRRRHLEKMYSLSSEQYETLLAQQNGVCAICQQPETRIVRGRVTPLIVDHDHTTNEVRGLVCHRCNLSIGYALNRPSILRRAADYLEAYLAHLGGNDGR